jgi:quinol-cytochrome oxidoreductase complex cytochrome b subunit
MSTLFGIPLSLWGVLCLVIATVYFFVWPKPDPKGEPRPMWIRVILRWCHSVVWVLLAGVCVLVATGNLPLAEPVAYLALLLYAAFIVTLFIDRQRSGKRVVK